MTWQDIVLSAGSWVFLIALFPSIFGKDKPPKSTSFLTGFILAVYVFVYASLHLWLAMFSTILMSAAWLTLGVQKWKMGALDSRLPASPAGGRGNENPNAEEMERKQENLEKVMAMARDKSGIRNDDIQYGLGVSDATATRYLEELEKQGKLQQSGSKKGVIYRTK